MKILLTAFALCLCLSCQQSITLEGCYMGTLGKDTVVLDIQTDQSAVSGNLDYKFWEKDRNSGTVSGEILGDSLLLLDYQFMSEGKRSMRQVAFLVKNSKLIEGYGPMEEAGAHLRFADVQQLSFSNAFVLQPTACQ